MNLFLDDDDIGYLIAEDHEEGTPFFELSDDFLRIQAKVAAILFSQSKTLESAAVFKFGKLYFFLGSRLTGWDQNGNEYATATRISGPWSTHKRFAPSSSKTCKSQTAFVSQTSAGKRLFMGDRWMKDILDESKNIWLPLDADENKREISMDRLDRWSLSEMGIS